LEAHRVERKLSAIFAADVEGYSLLMGRDEVGTPSDPHTAYRVIVDRVIASHRGRICRRPVGGSCRAGCNLHLARCPRPNRD
jgi:hypothetical protein